MLKSFLFENEGMNVIWNMVFLDKLFFVPVGNLYQKNELADEKVRFEMLQILCNYCEGLEVSDLEMNLNKNLTAIEVFELI